MVEKGELRKLIRARKGECPDDNIRRVSEEICSKIRNDNVWRTAETILLYHPLRDEVDIRPLITEAAAHKCVLLPTVDGDSLSLRIYDGDNSLTKGAFGIMEPTGTLFPVDRYHEIDLAVIPGMAFDHDGHRLGRGKGYYDRIIPLLQRTFLIGVCFPFQLLCDVPYEPHDMCVHKVVSTLP